MRFLGRTVLAPKEITLKGEKYKDTKGCAIIVGNHVSFKDPFFYAGVFNKHYLRYIASELVMDHSRKLQHFLLYYVGCIEINRNIYDIEGIRTAVADLKAGRSILMYPEGTLFHDNDTALSEIKGGAILLAVQSGVPIIPAYSLKREHWYNKRVIVVGEPFKISDYTTRKFPTIPEMDNIALELVKKINECKNVYDEYMAKQKK